MLSIIMIHYGANYIHAFESQAIHGLSYQTCCISLFQFSFYKGEGLVGIKKADAIIKRREQIGETDIISIVKC